MTSSNLPYQYQDGDIMNGRKENANHSYLLELLKRHNHSVTGEGGKLVDPVVIGTYTTDELEVNGTVRLVDIFGDNLYISSWTQIPNSGTYYTSFAYPSGQSTVPYILQVHLANNATPTEYQIHNIDMYNKTGAHDFVGKGTIVFDIGSSSNLCKVGMITRGVYALENSGTTWSPLDPASTYARVVAIY